MSKQSRSKSTANRYGRLNESDRQALHTAEAYRRRIILPAEKRGLPARCVLLVAYLKLLAGRGLVDGRRLNPAKGQGGRGRKDLNTQPYSRQLRGLLADLGKLGLRFGHLAAELDDAPEDAWLPTVKAMEERWLYVLGVNAPQRPDTVTMEVWGHLCELCLAEREGGAWYTPSDVSSFMADTAVVGAFIDAMERTDG